MTDVETRLREDVARIVDPDEWMGADRRRTTTKGRLVTVSRAVIERVCKRSLVKADAIHALYADRLSQLEAERDEEPIEPGAFEGDIFFGDRVRTARGTHRWTSGAWEPLPSDEEVLMDLLGKARLRANKAEAEVSALREEVERLRVAQSQPSGLEPSARSSGQQSEGSAS